MADQRVEDLTELTSPAAADKLYILDASETETDGDTDGKSKYITYSNLTSGVGGGLTMESAQSSGFTAVAGKLYPIDLDAASSNVLVTFPSSPTAGDEFGFFVAKQDTDTSVFGAAPSYGVEPAGTTKINGFNYVAETGGGVGCYGLFMNSESLIFRYYDATQGWLPVNDGRIPYHFSDIKAFSHTSTTALQTIPVALGDSGEAFGVYVSTSGIIKLRRKAKYFEFGLTAYSSLSAGYEIQAAVTLDPTGTPSVVSRNYNRTEYASGNIGTFCYAADYTPNPTDEYSFQVGQTNSTSQTVYTSYFVKEIFSSRNF